MTSSLGEFYFIYLSPSVVDVANQVLTDTFDSGYHRSSFKSLVDFPIH